MLGGFLIGIAAATLRIATTLILAGLGETLIERAGILNLGIEGIMTLGAFTGFLIVYWSGEVWLGILAAGLIGVLMGLLLGVLTINFRLQQHVCGLGLTITANGLALFLHEVIFASTSSRPQIAPMKLLEPFGTLPILGTLTRQYSLTYLALCLIPTIHLLLFSTPLGLRLRAVGEKPVVADVAGVNVFLVRYFALTLGSGLMGIAGAFLSVAQLGSFSYGIVAGRGWMSLALVVFGSWSPGRVGLGALLFGALEALQLRLQTMGWEVPFQIFLMLPYVLVIMALLVVKGKKSAVPTALLQPYQRGASLTS